MFTGELAESRQTEIIIHDIDECAMELLIDYCYTSRIVVDEKNVQVLLPAACILQVRILNDQDLYNVFNVDRRSANHML